MRRIVTLAVGLSGLMALGTVLAPAPPARAAAYKPEFHAIEEELTTLVVFAPAEGSKAETG